MPRIYASNNDPLDFCNNCFPKSEVKAKFCYNDLGDGPDDRGNCFEYDAFHPSYQNDPYYCEECKKLLESTDVWFAVITNHKPSGVDITTVNINSFSAIAKN